ncbi:MAG: AgmX/PglI C-terminal domain-containing protein [Bdellovibrionaceae bacterium]|nr:AgmX/PglI C-terminal domain-containing protein [Bdellovibrio sp.]
MGVLKLKQTTHDGRSKVWRIDPKSPYQTFGSSRKANIVSIDDMSSAFDSAFEYRADGWHFISFDLKSAVADQAITPATVIDLKKSMIQFEIIEKEEHLLKDFDKLATQGAMAQQIYLVVHKNRILESHLTTQGHAFPFAIHGKKHNFNFKPTTEWFQEEHDGFVIKSKIVNVNSAAHLGEIPKGQVLDAQSKKTLAITLGVTALLVFLSFLAPKNETPSAMALPKSVLNVVVKLDKKKAMERHKQASAPKPQNPTPTQAQQQPSKIETNQAASGGKVSALLKGAVGVRISQLIGKVSATEARTANVLVTTSGVKAGEGPSGRALAAVGKVESSGRNWNGESSGSGSGVSTSGIGGGKGTQALGGGLGQGKTGSGGVGLIEEESEVSGGLDREVIAQYIKTQLGQILYCYERQLSATPDLYGKVAVKFTIASTGQVETQAINDTTLKNSSVEGCILNKVAKWKFPEPKGGTKVLVTYPFLFKSTN